MKLSDFGPNHPMQEQIRKQLHDNPPRSQLPDSAPQQDQAPTLGAAIPGEAQGVGRPGVRFTLYRLGLLDDDSAHASAKDLLDGLHHAGLIPGDAPNQISLTVDQIKVSHRKDQRTEITITTP